MPGMMDTLLNVGITEQSVTSDFTADCYRRLGDGWRSVIGPSKAPDDVWAQLRAAVEAVFGSWHSERARAYRAKEGIADDLGTAVTVQAMVFGNRGPDSGTGVLFTRDPSTGEPGLYGDFMFNAQGEDVVAGTHATDTLAALGARLPDVAAELERHARTLELYYRDLCDIEFTVEAGRLWMLQVRVGKRSPRAALRIASDMANEGLITRGEAVGRVAHVLAQPPRQFIPTNGWPEPLATGLPASPGVASGVVVRETSAIEAAGGPVILVRRETSPEDVPAMARSVGILTQTGGLASHAAVVARGWGIPAVVGAGVLQVEPGTVITINGSTGAVYLGEVAGHWDEAPEVATLLAWANDLAKSPSSVPALTESRDDFLRTLAIKGTAQLDVEPDALIEKTDECVRLTTAGKRAAAELFAADAAALGEARGLELLEEFHALDERMKAIVTAWQLRDPQTLNDHSDAEYDARVLADLAMLNSDAEAWLAPLAEIGPRFDVYRKRLARAVELASTDQRFVASPRVDSYHTVWFELHEDHIRSTGRSRADEVTAGRA
jgi:pyruvate,orthophosphate dikinase